MNLSKDLTDFLSLLKEHQVEFAICGGHAVAFHGYPRLTMDLDILILPTEENSLKLMDTLNAFGFGACGMPQEAFRKEGTVVTLGEQPNQIDLLTSMSHQNTRDVINNSVSGNLAGYQVRFVSKDDLIRAKREAMRPKDIADLHELLEGFE